MRRTWVVNRRALLLSRGRLRRCGWRRRRLVMDAPQWQVLALATGLDDLLPRRCAKLLGLDCQLLFQRAIAEYFHPVKQLAGQSRFDQRLGRDRRPVVELIQLLDVDNGVDRPEVRVVEPALRNAA